MKKFLHRCKQIWEDALDSRWIEEVFKAIMVLIFVALCFAYAYGIVTHPYDWPWK